MSKQHNYYQLLTDLEDSYFFDKAPYILFTSDPTKIPAHLTTSSDSDIVKESSDEEIDFFIDEELTFKAHPSIVQLGSKKTSFELPPANSEGEIIIECVELCGL